MAANEMIRQLPDPLEVSDFNEGMIVDYDHPLFDCRCAVLDVAVRRCRIPPLDVQTKTSSLAVVGVILSMYGLWQAIVRVPVVYMHGLAWLAQAFYSRRTCA